MITPMPWVVRERVLDEYNRYVSVVMAVPGSYPEDIICEVWGAEHDDQANARLIAAAPDLLEACLRVVEMHSLHRNCEERKILEVAIQKATIQKAEDQ